jgi:SNF2 family DNA or RNA helicase
LQPAIRFKKEDCIDLPPITYVDREAELTAEQTAAYKKMMKQLIIDAETAKGQGVVVTAINAAAKLTKLLQICSGAVYSDDGRVATLDMAPRLKVLEELIEQAGKKVLVFVPFRHAIERVHQHLVEQGITCDVMHGGITGRARSDLLARFTRDPDPKVLIAHPRTASHGLNLTCANVAVWMGPTFSAEQYQQACERMARPGQDSHMTVVNVHSSPVERKAFDVLSKKQSMQRTILSLYEDLSNV